MDEEYWGGEVKGGGFGVCKESDVYGFGVVLLEFLVGRRNEEGLFVRWVLFLIKEMRFSEFLDFRFDMFFNLSFFVRFVKVVLVCVGNFRKIRFKIF